MKTIFRFLKVESNHTMKIFLRPALLASFMLLLAFSANAQTTEENATVYIYMMDHRDTIGRLTVPVLFDGREIARLTRNRYLIAKMPAGRHVLTSKNEKSVALTVDLKPGENYYVRINIDGGTFKLIPPEFTRVSMWEGRSYVGDMKLIDPKDITDESIVPKTMPAPTPKTAEKVKSEK